MSIGAMVDGGLPVIPILVGDDPLALESRLDDFADAGIKAIEVVLRTPRSLEVLARAAGHPRVSVGAGTVLTPSQLADVVAAGAAFAVSPGYDPDLVAEAAQLDIAYLPGVATSSEVMRAWRAGITAVKFFPAEFAGGAPFLAAMAQVYPLMRFVPTGGIDLETAPQYLRLSNVIACGGSWLGHGLTDRRDLHIVTLAATRVALTPFTRSAANKEEDPQS
ncbi:bifunctional 4-hydroxy-2-oxoglutarate aldolase/2-dehydro-3-deoxy-phosphogluconate aldolase [Nocardia sp. CWNU-33]|uniref:bifunctional 4-hydroxy-2-oxoglutarate aldolase/2-dehydro-3-deoxy-phosphogluconate aldolase n=1 Tax=Nocardia sp. CWNU-33 TaxID=3392117 RepID=UPI00398E93B4